MTQKHPSPESITDQEIKDAFAKAPSISFSARPFNFIEWRSVSIHSLCWWIPLVRLLPLIGIQPQNLRPVFNPQPALVKRQFPFNLRWFGLNKNRYKTVQVELPEHIDTYDMLGMLPLDELRFYQLASVIGKPIEVYREDGGTGEHNYLFTASPTAAA
ncbi:MAG: hypothetical protein A3E37_02330 [Candidatus Andersenbacteria bacterium RIFCSPHIGHO2_12_FULL_46_9]|nr:MAG: hypothetical protein UW94_C0011G0041 [Parcubacteria group bacterium GW2011_GWA2_45_14]OGY34585.1 MAG: hypothetical protein A3B76_06365 [Candidatus Andersenbacteria bacterium RIFCSPHIGHO2_02_FULL_46_16]OGY36377.1 MAG: hypothetical protein A3E37_02330 [Candidatus Andersenbacteria bacterium RIFCSPHIGHO2_12_FULL_46_9]OGY37870.1 MAG: hypothetical protein A3I08_01620 [Candidatus Andersenbacteria bacterium RIFCSPLOWO2_02_FULL_46_11]OGY42666.1 MAG: hypothetical protein A3G57_03460 [Candidatus A